MTEHHNIGSMNLREFLFAIWPHLRALDSHIQILGGLALLLKQEWIRDNGITSFIPMSEWTGENIPRTTKDIDMGVSADLLANVNLQEQLQQLLNKWEFETGPGNRQKRWAWKHKSGNIIMEFHALSPNREQHTQLVAKDSRVKNKKLHGKKIGIHGRINDELLGLSHHLSFGIQGCNFNIPNVVTALMMKLKAYEERLLSHLRGESGHQNQLEVAQKHARDVMRIIAMETEQDQQLLPLVYAEVGESELFRQCGEIVRTHFSARGQEGYDAASDRWTEENYGYLTEQLAARFTP